jgi:hypothetical protein
LVWVDAAESSESSAAKLSLPSADDASSKFDLLSTKEKINQNISS